MIPKYEYRIGWGKLHVKPNVFPIGLSLLQAYDSLLFPNVQCRPLKDSSTRKLNFLDYASTDSRT